jgi:hypothetical protein
VQIAAAEPDSGDIAQGFACRALPEIERRDAGIACGMEEDGMGHRKVATRYANNLMQMYFVIYIGLRQA